MAEVLVTIYTVCAVVGGTILLCQFVMTVFGIGGHHDVGGHDLHDVSGHGVLAHGGHDPTHEEQSSWFAGLLTFRTIVAALAFFGLAGRAATATQLDPAQSLGIALATGAAALFLVGWLIRTLYSLGSDGTLRVRRAIGQVGTVYLPIPGHRAGAGKITLNLQNRTVELQAVTADEPLPVGAKIAVVGLISSDTVEVVPAPTPERISHVEQPTGG
jgi:hypothetical protein